MRGRVATSICILVGIFVSLNCAGKEVGIHRSIDPAEAEYSEIHPCRDHASIRWLLPGIVETISNARDGKIALDTFNYSLVSMINLMRVRKLDERVTLRDYLGEVLRLSKEADKIWQDPQADEVQKQLALIRLHQSLVFLKQLTDRSNSPKKENQDEEANRPQGH